MLLASVTTDKDNNYYENNALKYGAIVFNCRIMKACVFDEPPVMKKLC